MKSPYCITKTGKRYNSITLLVIMGVFFSFITQGRIYCAENLRSLAAAESGRLRAPTHRTGAGAVALTWEPRIDQRRRQLKVDKIIKELGSRGIKIQEDNLARALISKLYIVSKRPQDIKLENFHYDILAALFAPVGDDGIGHTKTRYIYDIMDKKGLQAPDLVEAIEIDYDMFELADIGKGKGEYREVDRVTIVGRDAEGKPVQAEFTASIDRRSLSIPIEKADRHSEAEFKNLKLLTGRTKLVAVPYGYIEYKHPRTNKLLFRVIFRDYVEGADVATYVNYFLLTGGHPRAKFMRDLFYEVGNTEGRFYMETGYFFVDNHWGNMIIDESRDGKIHGRPIDLTAITNDPRKISLILAISASRFASKLRLNPDITPEEKVDYVRAYFQGFRDACGNKADGLLRAVIPKLDSTIDVERETNIPLMKRQIEHVLSSDLPVAIPVAASAISAMGSPGLYNDNIEGSI